MKDPWKGSECFPSKSLFIIVKKSHRRRDGRAAITSGLFKGMKSLFKRLEYGDSSSISDERDHGAGADRWLKDEVCGILKVFARLIVLQ